MFVCVEVCIKPQSDHRDLNDVALDDEYKDGLVCSFVRQEESSHSLLALRAKLPILPQRCQRFLVVQVMPTRVASILAIDLANDKTSQPAVCAFGNVYKKDDQVKASYVEGIKNCFSSP